MAARHHDGQRKAVRNLSSTDKLWNIIGMSIMALVAFDRKPEAVAAFWHIINRQLTLASAAD